MELLQTKPTEITESVQFCRGKMVTTIVGLASQYTVVLKSARTEETRVKIPTLL